MFVKLISLIVLLSCVSVALSAVAISQPSIHPDYPGKCWDSDTKKAYDRNAVFTAPDSCTRVSCLSDLSFEYATCGVIATEPPCYVTDGDLSLQYPMCCPDVKCPEEQ